MGFVFDLPPREARPPVILVWVVLIGAASYRVWRLVGQDSITEPLRARLSEWALDLVSCGWCLGSWIAFGLTWATDIYIGLDVPVLVGLASAAVVGWLSEL